MNNSPDWKKDKRRRLLGCSKWLSIFGGILVFGALAMVSMRSFIVEAFNDARHKSFMAPAGKMFAHNADHFYFAAVSDTGARTEPVEEIMNEIRDRIRTAFFNDRLMTSGNVQMTATESLMRGEERMRLLGPVAGRIQTELLGPMIDRVFGLLLRRGKIPPPPKGVGTEIRVEYVSPLAMVQKQQEAQAVLKTVEAASPLVTLDPEAGKVFNAPEIIRKLGKVFGASDVLLRSEAELRKAGGGDA